MRRSPKRWLYALGIGIDRPLKMLGQCMTKVLMLANRARSNQTIPSEGHWRLEGLGMLGGEYGDLDASTALPMHHPYRNERVLIASAVPRVPRQPCIKLTFRKYPGSGSIDECKHRSDDGRPRPTLPHLLDVAADGPRLQPVRDFRSAAEGPLSADPLRQQVH